MIVDEIELIGQLGEVNPLPDEALQRAEATLRAAMATAAAGGQVRIGVGRHPGSRSRRPRLFVAAAAGAAASFLVVIVALGAASGPGRPAPTVVSGGGRPAATATAAGQTMRLASYEFQLPADYRTVRSYCTAMPPDLGPAIPTAGVSSFAAAASTGGGCIEAVMAAGDAAAIPARARSVQVGPYQGFLTSGTANSIVLSVAMPTMQGHRDLVLVASGMSADQVVAIAKSGLPSSIGPTTSCTTSCG